MIVGTKAIDEPEWLAAEAERNPGRLMLALDTRDGRVLRKGWTEDTGIRVEDFLAGIAELPIAGVLSTDVGREGKMEGIDRASVARVIEACPHPVWISGGVTTADELEYLGDIHAAGAVLGMALYTETLDPATIAPRWGGRDIDIDIHTGGTKENR